jgi:hypothetical protein
MISTLNIDLNILEGDLSLDDFLSPSQITNADVISQDIKHRLIESGKLPPLIGLRNTDIVNKILTEIELIVEQDTRLVPGTIKITLTDMGVISVTAKTQEYGVVINGL